MLVFDGSFGSYALRQLIANFNGDKDVYIDHIEWDFSKYVEKKLGRIGWNSRIICILKHYWCLNWALVRCQRFLNKTFTYFILNWEENKCSVPLMITDFNFNYNIKCKHSTTKMTPREVLFNYKNKEMFKKVIKKYREVWENFYQEIYYDVGYSLLITSWHLEPPNKWIRTFNRENPLKGTKGVRKEINSINGTIIKNFIIAL